MTGGNQIALGEGREFDAVRSLLAAVGATAAGVGGDCAELRVPDGELLCVSTDSAVEGVHFRFDWIGAAEVGYRATAAALSDLAAAGARPLGALLAISIPDSRRDAFIELGRGVGEALRDAGALLLGGDTVRGEELSLTLTVLGAARVPMRRDGARAGDDVYVTGRLGGPDAAVRAWLARRTPSAGDRARFARPTPRLREGQWLAVQGATAAVDVSDGLVADLGHVAAASGVEIALDIETLPCVEGVTPESAAVGGEEYELALTGRGLDVAAFAARFGVPLTRIGAVTDGAPGVIARRRGLRVDLPGGYDHFSA